MPCVVKRLQFVSTAVAALMIVLFWIRSGTASLDPPNRVWWADCHSDGLVKACRQGGNQSNLTLEYGGFLLESTRAKEIQVFVKLNGRQGVFSLAPTRMESAQLFLGSRFSSCRRSSDANGTQLICVESAPAVQEFLTQALRDGETQDWQLEVFFLEPSTGRRDDNSGRNYLFDLKHL